MKTSLNAALAILSMLAAGHAIADEAKKAPDARTEAYRDSLSEDQLRADAARVKGELAALLEEYGGYRSAGDELSRIKSVAGGLDKLQDQDMRTLVQTLREASRVDTEDGAKAKIQQAASSRTAVQTRLRELADELALRRSQAAMVQRLEDLALRQAANLRETRKTADSGSTPKDLHWDVKETAQQAQQEQKALTAETAAVENSLKHLAAMDDPAAAKAFSQALAKVEDAHLAEKAQQAENKMNEDFHQAADAQKQVLDGLKDAIASLEANRPKEERERELGQKLEELAEKQKDLAAATTRVWGGSQEEIRHDEGAISDQADLAQMELQQLNGDAASQVADARQTTDNLANELNKQGLLDHVDSVAHATDEQNHAAEKLSAAAETLQKEAAALAKEHGGQDPSQGQAQGQQDAASQAEQARQAEETAKMRSIASDLQNAHQQMEMANRQLQQHGDRDDAGRRMDRAGQELQQAQAAVQVMGDNLPKNVGEHIAKAMDQNSQSRQGVGKGDENEQEHARWKLDEAQREVDRAMTDLQNAADQMAQRQQAKQNQQQAQHSGKPTGEDRSVGPRETGDQSNTDLAETNLTAGGKRDMGQREALSLLKQEKAPPEYEDKVQQYIRNLANGQLPSK